MISLILLFLCTLFSSYILIKIAIKMLLYFGVLDMPSKRRTHTNITPRGGGIALVIALTICGSSFEYIISGSLIYSNKIGPIIYLISLVSFIDDIKTIPVIVRLMVHIFCAVSFVCIFIYPIFSYYDQLVLFFNILLLSLALTAFLNIYNFMDGIDGITAVESIHLTTTILILCLLKSECIVHIQFVVVISILICACSISFLSFNWPPAKIFIGDIGSISFGFLIGTCLLLISTSSIDLLFAAVIASLYYLADGGLTILIRLVNGEKIWRPHLKHFFQKAVKKGMPVEQIIKQIIGCNMLLMLLSFSALYFPILSSFFALITVTLTLYNFCR
ncbi:MAG: UDP-phosphate alpha-N-acetylglucosaminyltransferase [Rickettsiaceae bacterium]|nr:MAG: UDP-phosphate alpha-N-acetylglucosaminyltransferase [Rickettsiaceae bacterium]